jgi:hypothetical protein
VYYLREINKGEKMKEKYLSLTNDFDSLNDFVDSLTQAQKIELREALEAEKSDKLIMPLYYDYENQRYF